MYCFAAHPSALPSKRSIGLSLLLYRLAPTVLDAVTIVRPETIVRWHRAGFRTFWRWKSRRRPGRPKVALEVRQLIREMNSANPFWGAPRIHGELLKLGIDVGQTSVAKYMARRRRPPLAGLENVSSQSCRWDRLHRSIRGPDDLIPTAIRVPGLPTRSPAHPMARRH